LRWYSGLLEKKDEKKKKRREEEPWSLLPHSLPLHHIVVELDHVSSPPTSHTSLVCLNIKTLKHEEE
jgi:hypothetical protein